MRRLFTPGIILPLALAVVGVALIVVGQLKLDGPGQSLAPIPDSPAPSTSTSTGGTPGVSIEPTASPTPIPASWVAVQIEVPSVEVNIAVKHAQAGQCGFPPADAVYVLCESSEPGRGTNSYIIGHALQHVFKRLWNVTLGAEVKILMSDGVVLRYVVTEIHPNVSCPDSREAPMPNPPLALRYAAAGCPGATWIRPTDHERLTLQTSQGFNRNWGELVVIAKPLG